MDSCGTRQKSQGQNVSKPPQEWIETGRKSRECLYFGVRVKCNKVDNAHVEPMPVPLLEILDSGGQKPVEFSQQLSGRTLAASTHTLEGSWLPPHRDSTKFTRGHSSRYRCYPEQEVVFATDILGSRHLGRQHTTASRDAGRVIAPWTARLLTRCDMPYHAQPRGA